MTRWHVFQLQAFYLRSAANALQAIGSFAQGQLPRPGEQQ